MTRQSWTVPTPPTFKRFSASPLAIDEGRCPACDVYLARHQPDPARPDRLLGVCEGCGRWYLVDLAPGADEAVMVLLPETRGVLEAVGRTLPKSPQAKPKRIAIKTS